MKQVTQIKPKEIIIVDEDRLSALYAQLGESCAEDVVCRAMEELALRLSYCERLYRTASWPELRKSARSLIAIADQIGMTAVSTVANDVTQCIDENNMVALSATFHRLMRNGEASLTAIWKIEGLTI